MIGMIVAGHGRFGSGITSVLELVAGRPADYQWIDFEQGESQEELEEAFREKLRALKPCEKIVIFTDVAGGSPYKTALMCAFEDQRLEVVSGTSVPVLLEFAFGRMEGDPGRDLTEQALRAGREQIARVDRKAFEAQ